MDTISMNYSRTERLILALTTLYYTLIFIYELLPGGQMLSFVPLIAVMITSLVANKGKVVVSRQRQLGVIIYIFCFIAFCVLSRLWAENPTLVIRKVNSLLLILVATTILVFFVGNLDNSVNYFLKAIMYGGYIACLFFWGRYGFGGVLSLVRNSNRISNEYINANSLGVCAAYSIVINFYFILYRKFKISDLLMIPSIIIIFASVSRKAFLIVIIGVLGSLILKNTYNKNALKNIGRVLFTIAVVIFLIFLLSKLPIFSAITERTSNLISLLQGNETRYTSNAWIRLAYNRLGIQLFKEHPIIGIGIANANIYTDAYYGHDAYLHNNFIELLACGGIVGFFIYYSIWAIFLVTFLKFRKQRGIEYDICLILLVLRITMDYGAVTYYSRDTYLFLLLFFIVAKRLRSSQKKANTLNGIS